MSQRPHCLSVASSRCLTALTSVAAWSREFAGQLGRHAGVPLTVWAGLLGLCSSTQVQAQIVATAGTTTTTVYQGTQGGEGLALDAAGNIYTGFDAGVGLYKTTYSNGAYTTAAIAGSPAYYFYGVTVDATGAIYAAEANGRGVYKVVGSGTTYTFTQIISGISAAGVAVDGYGNVSTNNYATMVYKYTLSGGVYTQHAIATDFSTTRNMAIDSNGVIYQTSYNGGSNNAGRLAVLTPSGAVATTTTYVETTLYNCLHNCAGVAVASNGVVYVGDGTTVVQFTPNGSGGFIQKNISTSYTAIRGMAVDSNGNVLVADLTTKNISKTTTTLTDFGSVNVASTSASQAVNFTVTSNTGSTAFGTPIILTQGVSGKDYALGTNTCTGVPAANSTCTVNVTFAPLYPGERDGAVELTDSTGNVVATALIRGTGSAPHFTATPAILSTAASNTTTAALALSNNQNVIVNPAGTMYIASAANNTVYKVSGGTAISYGTGFTVPVALALDGAGNLYVAENGAGDVKVINAATGATSVVNGATGLGSLNAIAVDGSGNLYAASYGSNYVYKITPAGVLSIVAGTGASGYNGDNIQATAAQLNQPIGLGGIHI